MEGQLKPPILRFLEKVEAGEVVEEHLLEEVGEWRGVTRVLGEMVGRVGHMGRAELVRLVQTLLRVRGTLQARAATVVGIPKISRYTAFF